MHTSSPFDVSDDILVWRGGGETVQVEPWGANSVRVRATRQGEIRNNSWALLPATNPAATVEIEGTKARLRNGNLVVEITADGEYDLQTGYQDFSCTLSFSDTSGALLFEEIGRGGSLKLNARDYRPSQSGGHQVTVAFAADADEKLYGMGQYQQHILDIKGSAFELAHRNSQVSVPFVLSSAGYGFLWHNPAIGRATFAANRTEWCAESTDQIDYWVTAGDSPAQITAAYADATGHAPMMPEYGLGFWQCKLRYYNQEQLLEVAREHHRRGVPLDVIVADFFHWPKMGDFRFEDEFWPDPTAMVAELRELGVELMVSVWPQVSTESENFAEMRGQNFLATADRGLDIHMAFEGPSAFFDVTNPRARDYLWGKIAANYGSHGIKLFWLDEAEPEWGRYTFDNYRYHAGSVAQVGNIYPQLFSRTFYDGRLAAGDTEIVNLVRAAWAGSQRYGALVWSGDINSTWEDFATQITAGIHMGIAGIPWFTTDIGGFHNGNVNDPAFRELLIRWFQFGAFAPVMRLHGDRKPSHPVSAADGSRRLPSGAENEIWSYGKDTYDILSRYVHLREKLRPYLREVMRDAHENGQPVMRAMFHEFPDDERAWTCDDQYMLGPDLLVAPVVIEGAIRREVCLPAGTTWTSLWSGSRHEGGQVITVDAPIEDIPVFVRGNAFDALIREIRQSSIASPRPREFPET